MIENFVFSIFVLKKKSWKGRLHTHALPNFENFTAILMFYLAFSVNCTLHMKREVIWSRSLKIMKI